MAKRKRNNYTTPTVRRYNKGSTLNLYLTGAAAVIAALATLLSVNVFFNLANTGLSINGNTLYEPEQIQVVGGLVPGQNLVRLNTEFVEKRIKKELVYVDEVHVSKQYPDSLTIDIVEATPYAQLDCGGSYALISTSGRVLETDQTDRDKSLPLVAGFELDSLTPGTEAVSKDKQKTKIVTSLFAELHKLNIDKIIRIDVSDRTNIKLLYDNRIQIELGSSVDLDIKLLYIQSVLDNQKLPESFEGTLRFNGIDSGISAIPKKIEQPVAGDASDTNKEDKKGDIIGYDNDGTPIYDEQTDQSSEEPEDKGEITGYNADGTPIYENDTADSTAQGEIIGYDPDGTPIYSDDQTGTGEIIGYNADGTPIYSSPENGGSEIVGYNPDGTPIYGSSTDQSGSTYSYADPNAAYGYDYEYNYGYDYSYGYDYGYGYY